MPKPGFDPNRPFQPAGSQQKPAFDATRAFQGAPPSTPDAPNSSAQKPVDMSEDNSNKPGFFTNNWNQAGQVARDNFNQYAKGPEGQKIINGVASGGIGEAAAPIGALVKSLGSFLGNAAERSNILGMVKDPTKLGPYVAQKLQEAEEAFHSKQIDPRMDARTNLLQQATDTGNAATVNPESFKGLSPEIDSVAGQLPKGESVQISPDEYNALSSSVNKASRFKPGLQYDPASAAKVQAAKDAGDALRGKGYDIDPEIGQLGSELHDAYSLKDAALKGMGSKPISVVRAGSNLDKASTLGQFDQQAGTNLGQLGKNIDTAQTRLGLSPDLTGATGMGSMARQAIGAVPRAIDATAATVKPGVDKLGQLLSTPLGQKLGSAGLQQLFNTQTPTDGTGNGL